MFCPWVTTKVDIPIPGQNKAMPAPILESFAGVALALTPSVVYLRVDNGSLFLSCTIQLIMANLAKAPNPRGQSEVGKNAFPKANQGRSKGFLRNP